MYSTRDIPPELVEKILSHLADNNRTLCTCALVSRSWLQFSRRWFTVHIHPRHTYDDVFELFRLAGQQHSTLLSALGSLDVNLTSMGGGYGAPERAALAAQRGLTGFTVVSQCWQSFHALRSLSLMCTIPEHCPNLPPTLRRLELVSTRFESTHTLKRLLSALPQLRHLHFSEISFRLNEQNWVESLSLPPLQLDCLEPYVHIVFVGDLLVDVSTRKLIWKNRFSRYVDGYAHVAGASRYLNAQGIGLEELEIRDPEGSFQYELFLEVDYTPISNLRSLRLCFPLRLIGDAQFESISCVASLLNLLEQIVVQSHASIRELVLDAFILYGDDFPNRFVPLKHMVALLATPLFNALTRLELVVNGSATHSHAARCAEWAFRDVQRLFGQYFPGLETVVDSQGRTRQVVLTAGEDAMDFYRAVEGLA